MRRIFSRREIGERKVANFAPRVRLLEKAQRFLFRHFGELFVGPLSVSPLAIAEINEHIESRRARPQRASVSRACKHAWQSPAPARRSDDSILQRHLRRAA